MMKRRPLRNPRRLLVLLLLLLTGGALVNVAVAWGCAWNAPGRTMFWPAMSQREFVQGWGARYVLVFPNGDTGSLEDYAYYIGCFGFPIASVTCSYDKGVQSGMTRKVVSGQHETRWYALPVRLIWPGFAINTVFYAAILWGLFAAPFALRRRRRVKRGLCPACAYPVGTNDVCTECGRAVKP